MANEYVTSGELKATLSLTGETFADADIAVAVESASRAVDDLCGRRFYKDASAVARYYTPPSPRVLVIDDMVTLTSVKLDTDGDGTFGTTWTSGTEFVPLPLNAAADGKPYTRLEVRAHSSAYFRQGYDKSVEVTAIFGWDAVPPAVENATSILATILLKRMREAPFGVVALGVDTAARLASSDPHVRMLLDPYRRLAV